MADTRKKQLAFNIIDFLRSSSQDGTIKDDDKESVDIAIQCISEAFSVDSESPEDQKAYSIKPASLLSLLDVFSKTKSKATGDASATGAAKGPSEDDKAKAEKLKVEGNNLMAKKQYDEAIKHYTDAIKLNPSPVYYSNRAAANSANNDHAKASEDAERAIELDPNFAKAYSRLGHAKYCLQEYQPAIDAYEAGLKLDPSNQNMKKSLATAKERLGQQDSNVVSDREPAGGSAAGGMPDLASMFGGGGAGGMPDMASLMQNPQMMAMAQQMMANGGLERLMSNPTLRSMAENMQNGGGMPDINALASNPELRNLASQFMGGQGAQGGGQGQGQ